MGIILARNPCSPLAKRREGRPCPSPMSGNSHVWMISFLWTLVSSGAKRNALSLGPPMQDMAPVFHFVKSGG